LRGRPEMEAPAGLPEYRWGTKTALHTEILASSSFTSVTLPCLHN